MAPISRWPEVWLDMDIALCPLRHTPFNLSKSWIKGLEAASAGVTVISSDTPAYRALEVGRQCARPKHWFSALEAYLDPDSRSEAIAIGLKRAAEEDIAVRWTDWEKVYEDVRTS